MSEYFCRDVEALHGFLIAQGRINSAGFAGAQQSQCANIISRISTLEGFDFQGATRLINLIDQGPWTLEQKQSIADATQSRVDAIAVGKAVKQRRKNQVCTTFDMYLSEADLVDLTNADVSHMS